MCAINPTQKVRFIVDIYTSENVDKDYFISKVITDILKVERQQNRGRFRWHVKQASEMKLPISQEAD